MSAENFQALFDGFCEAAGIASEALHENADGVLAFSTEIDEVTINLMHTPDTHPAHAFVLVDFGPPPAERLADVLHALMVVNFTLLGEETASCFSIHPVYGNVTLQSNYPLQGRSGADLHASLRQLSAMALQWREQPFLPPQDASAQRPEDRPAPGQMA